MISLPLLVLNFLFVSHERSQTSTPFHRKPFLLQKVHSPIRTNSKQVIVRRGENPLNGEPVLTGDEPLSAKFQRAVVLQRSGDYSSALAEYDTFLKAASQCQIPPEMCAEVHVNRGAIYFRTIKDFSMARTCFKQALEFREVGRAYVNLALLTLAEGQEMNDANEKAVERLQEARGYCLRASSLGNDRGTIDVVTVESAKKILNDIDTMLQRIPDKGNNWQ